VLAPARGRHHDRGRGSLTTLAARSITVRFGHGDGGLTAVDRVDLEVLEGATVGVVGESGSGKSTLARGLTGLVPLAGGDVLLDGAPVRKRHGGRAVDGRRRVQMIFQDPFASLNPRMTVGDAIAEAALVGGGARRGTRREEVRRYLELVHLDPDLAGRLPRRLSGGQRQRVAIARALAARPEVLIADEITSSLDVSVQSAVLNLMRELRRELGISMMFVSHNLATVRYVSDSLAVMYLGRIVEVGPTEAVVSEPQHPYTRALLAAVPRMGDSPAAGPAEVELGDPPDPHHPPPGCHFHPRCPIGPAVVPERRVCVEQDPRDGAGERPHRTFCHFASAASGHPEAPAREEQLDVARDR
jgi:peptide/nickel transport system ATP-binding protein